jgi:hypothetical protein
MNKHAIVQRSMSAVLAGVLLTATSPLALAQTSTMIHSSTTTTTQQSAVIPAGTVLSVQTNTVAPYSLGQTVTGQLATPVVVNGMTVLPAGTQVRGEIVGVNSSMNTADIQFREVSLQNGDVIPIRGRVSVGNMVAANNLQGNVQTQTLQTGTSSNNYTLYPRVTWGREGTTRGGKIVGGTVGGALFGASTGALSGLVMPAVYREDIGFGEGTGALRGAAWGAVMGAGLGLVSGLVAAAADRDNVSVTSTTQTGMSAGQPMTNISTGSLEEIPVSQPVGGSSTINVILDEPVMVGM